eukprot:8473350-Alexandrium_andersonii.AAC.1
MGPAGLGGAPPAKLYGTHRDHPWAPSTLRAFADSRMPTRAAQHDTNPPARPSLRRQVAMP